MVGLNVKSCLMKDSKRIEHWRTVLTKVLGQMNKVNNKNFNYSD